MMNVDYGIACTLMSSIGSYVGTILIQKVVKKTNRFSYLIFILALVLLVSTIMIPAHTFIKLLNQIQNKENIWIFNSPC